jgi:PAS domain S-box-containing protein
VIKNLVDIPAAKPNVDLITKNKTRKISNEKYRFISENTVDVIWVLDPQIRKFTYVSPSIEKLCGYTAEEIMAFEISDNFSTDSLQVVNEWMTSILKSFIEKGRATETFLNEMDLPCKDGSFVRTEATATYLFNQQGKVEIIGISRNITERKVSETALRVSKAKLEAALESMTDAVFITDPEGRFIDFNEAFATFHKFRNKEECGKTMSEFHKLFDLYLENGELASIDQRPIPRALGGETVKNAEYKLRRKDTGETWVGSYSFSPLRDSKGKIVGSVTVARDITDNKRKEEIIRQKNIELTKAQKIAHIGSWLDYLPTGELTWSEEMYNIMGVPLNKPLNLSEVINVFPLEERERFSKAVDKAINQGKPYSEDYKIIRPDGSVRIIHDEGEMIYDKEGKAEIMIGTTQDITDRKNAQEILQESEQKYRSLFELMAQGVMYRNSKGQIISVNPAAEKILGLPFEKMNGRGSIDPRWHAVHEDGTLYTEETYPALHALKSGKEQHGIVGYFNIEKERYAWVICTATPQFRPGEEKPFQVLSTFEDISLLKESYSELTRVNQHLEEIVEQRAREILQLSKIQEAILNSVPDKFFRIDKNGIVLSFHTGSVDPMLIPPAQLIGKKVTEIFPEEISGMFMENIVKAFNTHKTHTFEYSMSVQGDENYFENRTLAISENEVLSIVREITEQKNLEKNLIKTLEKEKELNDLKSHFVSVASHEFRTPLSSILLTAENLLNYWSRMEEKKIVAKLSTIIEQVERLSDIVSNVLQVSKIQEGKIQFSPSKVDLITLCRNSQMNFNSNPNLLKKIAFQCEFKELNMMLDERLIIQVLNNLLSNAIKYSPEGPKVTIELFKQNEEILLSVQDQGIGIPEEDQGKLFQPFERGSNTKQIQGNGLGLNIVKEFLLLHGGEITYSSIINKGSTFIMHLPAKLVVK